MSPDKATAVNSLDALASVPESSLDHPVYPNIFYMVTDENGSVIHTRYGNEDPKGGNAESLIKNELTLSSNVTMLSGDNRTFRKLNK